MALNYLLWPKMSPHEYPNLRIDGSFYRLPLSHFVFPASTSWNLCYRDPTSYQSIVLYTSLFMNLFRIPPSLILYILLFFIPFYKPKHAMKSNCKSPVSSTNDQKVMFFKDISPGPHEAQLSYRLIHFWEAQNPVRKTIIGLEMLLIDEQVCEFSKIYFPLILFQTWSSSIFSFCIMLIFTSSTGNCYSRIHFIRTC